MIFSLQQKADFALDLDSEFSNSQANTAIP